MHTTSISDLKAKLSAYLDVVRAGEDVFVTDRGEVVARLTGASDSRRSAHHQAMIRAGLLRPPIAPMPTSFRDAELPHDPEGLSLKTLLEERADGR
jgi:prevent-host-death family protein